MYRIVKTHYFDMAHRIRGHQGKCRNLHGHTWKVEVCLSCKDDDLNELGMVIDFSDVKKLFFNPLHDKYDHSLMLGKSDEQLRSAITEAFDHHTKIVTLLQEHTVTSEKLAKLFFDLAVCAFAEHLSVKVDYVRVYEQLHPTELYAEYRPEE